MASILTEILNNKRKLLSSYADITGNLNNFEGLVPKLESARLITSNQAEEARNETRHPNKLSKGVFVWDILLGKMTNANLRLLELIFMDTGNDGVAQLLAEAQLESATKHPPQKLVEVDVVRIRDLILEDPLTFHKWQMVVDHIVRSPNDAHEIKEMIRRDHDFAGAILRTLQVWNAFVDANRPDLLQILRDVGQQRLASQLQELIS